jgi:hypothetical protein
MFQLRLTAIPLFVVLLFVCSAAQGLEMPSGPLIFSPYDGITAPIPDANGAASRPIAFGSVAKGGDSLSLQIRTGQFNGPVDLYLGLTMHEIDPAAILLITGNLQIQPLSSGLVPWKAGVSSADETLFGTIPISALPRSRYTIYLLAVPAGTAPSALFENCYLWSSYFTTLDLIALSNQAVGELGGGAEAAAAILLSLGRGNSLEQVVRAILLGTLTENGELSGASGQHVTAEGSKRPLSSACEGYWDELDDNTFNDISVCRTELVFVYHSVIEGLMAGGVSEDELKALVTALTILAANRGYSPKQIYDAINEMLLIGSMTIDDQGFIWKNCSGILCKNELRWKVEPIDPLASFIDFLETGEAEDNGGLPEYGLSEFIGQMCAPILMGGVTVKAEGVFDFGTCPTPSAGAVTFPAYYCGTGTYTFAREWKPQYEIPAATCVKEGVRFKAALQADGTAMVLVFWPLTSPDLQGVCQDEGSEGGRYLYTGTQDLAGSFTVNIYNYVLDANVPFMTGTFTEESLSANHTYHVATSASDEWITWDMRLSRTTADAWYFDTWEPCASNP